MVFSKQFLLTWPTEARIACVGLLAAVGLSSVAAQASVVLTFAEHKRLSASPKKNQVTVCSFDFEVGKTVSFQVGENGNPSQKAIRSDGNHGNCSVHEYSVLGGMESVWVKYQNQTLLQNFQPGDNLPTNPHPMPPSGPSGNVTLHQSWEAPNLVLHACSVNYTREGLKDKALAFQSREPISWSDSKERAMTVATSFQVYNGENCVRGRLESPRQVLAGDIVRFLIDGKPVAEARSAVPAPGGNPPATPPAPPANPRPPAPPSSGNPGAPTPPTKVDADLQEVRRIASAHGQFLGALYGKSLATVDQLYFLAETAIQDVLNSTNPWRGPNSMALNPSFQNGEIEGRSLARTRGEQTGAQLGRSDGEVQGRHLANDRFTRSAQSGGITDPSDRLDTIAVPTRGFDWTSEPTLNKRVGRNYIDFARPSLSDEVTSGLVRRYERFERSDDSLLELSGRFLRDNLDAAEAFARIANGFQSGRFPALTGERWAGYANHKADVISLLNEVSVAADARAALRFYSDSNRFQNAQTAKQEFENYFFESFRAAYSSSYRAGNLWLDAFSFTIRNEIATDILAILQTWASNSGFRDAASREYTMAAQSAFANTYSFAFEQSFRERYRTLINSAEIADFKLTVSPVSSQLGLGSVIVAESLSALNIGGRETLISVRPTDNTLISQPSEELANLTLPRLSRIEMRDVVLGAALPSSFDAIERLTPDQLFTVSIEARSENKTLASTLLSNLSVSFAQTLRNLPELAREERGTVGYNSAQVIGQWVGHQLNKEWQGSSCLRSSDFNPNNKETTPLHWTLYDVLGSLSDESRKIIHSQLKDAIYSKMEGRKPSWGCRRIWERRQAILDAVGWQDFSQD